jgi:phage terminase large subunit GpA-like protein
MVPTWASALLATVDVQHRFFKVVVRAWGRSPDENSMESARVWHGRLEKFEDLDALLAREWPSEDAGRGRPMKITVLLIDTGGTRLGDEAISRTEQVNRWALSRQPFGVIPIKGTPRRQNRTDYIKRAKRVQHPGLEERLLDVHHFADELAWFVDKGRENPDEEVWRLNKRDDPEYNQELSNCVKVVERVGNKIDTAWRPVSDGATIDFFDCEVYQVAAAYIAQERGPFPARNVIDAEQKAAAEAVKKPPEIEERPDPWKPTAYKL